MHWWNRLLCLIDGKHLPPDDWKIRVHDGWVTCCRCGTPFDAEQQEFELVERQNFSM